MTTSFCFFDTTYVPTLLASSDAQIGLYVKPTFNGAGIVVHSNGATKNRTLYTSGAIAHFNNNVIISDGGGLRIGGGEAFYYDNVINMQSLIVTGSPAEFQTSVIVNTGSFGIGPFYSGSEATYLLHVSQSSSTAYTSYFEDPSGNYIATSMTGSKMIYCRASQATQSDLASIPGIQVWNESQIVGAGAQISLITDSAYAGIIGRRVGANEQALDFYTENTTRSIDMTIAHDGQVGIGTTNPLFKLHVPDDTGSFGFVSSSTSFAAAGNVGITTTVAVAATDGEHEFVFVGGILTSHDFSPA